MLPKILHTSPALKLYISVFCPTYLQTIKPTLSSAAASGTLIFLGLSPILAFLGVLYPVTVHWAASYRGNLLLFDPTVYEFLILMRIILVSPLIKCNR